MIGILGMIIITMYLDFIPYNYWLVVWNMAFMTFHSVGKFVTPTDELIFFRGVGLYHQPDEVYKNCYAGDAPITSGYRGFPHGGTQPR